MDVCQDTPRGDDEGPGWILAGTQPALPPRMLVYRSSEQRVDATLHLSGLLTQLAEVASRPFHDRLRDALVDVGEFESAVVDALFTGEPDGAHPLAERLREATVATAQALWLSWRGAASLERRRACMFALECLRRVPASWLPPTCALRTAEGYAFYGVYPEMYFASADHYARTTPMREALVLGVRSIGTSLGAAVVAALRGRGIPTVSTTVRPGGHPLDRSWRPREDLRSLIANRAERAHLLVVDEGPGASGTTFASIADGLADAGVPRDRIVFVSSHDADPAAFCSERGRRAWERHRHVAAEFDDLYIRTRRLQRRFAVVALRDYSAGAWRQDVLDVGQSAPAVHPLHERRKYRAGDGPLLKFTGFGRYGREYVARARALADEGWSAPFIENGDGFGLHAFVPGRALAPHGVTPGLLATCAQYLAWIGRRFVRAEVVAHEPLQEMMRVNVAEVLGDKWAGVLGAVGRRLEVHRDRPAVALDARMLPHEWIATTGGFVKVDGVEHHDDHFFPGPTDVAWDVAATLVEFGLDSYKADFFLDRFEDATSDASLRDRVPAFVVAYLAFRAGYANLAASTLGASDDGVRFSRAARRYARRLRRALVAWPALVPAT